MPEIKLIEDYGNKNGKHVKKNEWWLKHNIEVVRYPLPVADYILVNDKVQDVLDRKAGRGLNPKKMDFLGTYNVAVDSKQNVYEVANNVCGPSHARFKDELLLAQNNNIKLYILVESDLEWISKSKNIYNEPVKSIQDLFHWKNKRAFIWKNGKQLYPNCVKGSILAKSLMTLETRYGCTFVFTTSDKAGEKILDLLQGDNL